MCRVKTKTQSLSILSKPLRKMGWLCNGRQDCTNTDLDENLGCGEVVTLPRVGGSPSGNVCGDACVEVTKHCTVHKHSMCDGVVDCGNEGDEMAPICRRMTQRTACIRRELPGSSAPFPMSWVMDGVQDCVDGVDEDAAMWTVCGDVMRYVEKGEVCQNAMICPRQYPGYISYGNICSDDTACGNELEVCKVSRTIPTLSNIMVAPASKMTHRKLNEKILLMSYCVKGLENIQNHLPSCKKDKLIFPAHNYYGVTPGTNVILPAGTMNCDGSFGEQYLYRSCLGRCPNSPCPLQTVPRYEHCPAQFTDRVGTLANNDYLTFFVKSYLGEFENNFFVCKDGRRCVPHSAVCDLQEDCEDGSDEEMCTNNFKCSSGSSKYIPISAKCDRHVDCLDLSDECNANCTKRIIENPNLQKLLWSLGILSVAANLMVITKISISLRRCKAAAKCSNKILIGLISIGNSVTGVYLILISMVDTVWYGDDYCPQQTKWLTSRLCSTLGVLSTFGFQVSLFAMTWLSLLQVKGVSRTLRIHGDVTKRSVLFTVAMVWFIVLSSILLAMTPILESFEDYFVLAMKYAPQMKLFVGFTDKSEHAKVVNAYYGRIRGNKDKQFSWQTINNLVYGMFTHEVNSADYVRDKTQRHFYGNSDICLFKYMVTPNGFYGNNDPHRFFVWAVLSLNLFCVLVILLSFLVITCVARQSSYRLRKNAVSCGKENPEMQQRSYKTQKIIAIIIITDLLCWVPFILAAALHSMGFMVDQKFYSSFSIIVLSINSLINPIVYGEVLSKPLSMISGSASKVKTALMKRLPSRIFKKSRKTTSSSDSSESEDESETESGLPMNTLSISDNVFDSTLDDNGIIDTDNYFENGILSPIGTDNDVIDSDAGVIHTNNVIWYKNGVRMV